MRMPIGELPRTLNREATESTDSCASPYLGVADQRRHLDDRPALLAVWEDA
ncbi:MAG: hypothetical protein QOK36_3710 [Gaiellales bacterium]|jgi:hypothetical protein|nr:hypothetical protein [Gaiellales bacterium]